MLRPRHFRRGSDTAMASIRKRTWESGGETKTAWVADYFDQKRKRHIKTFPTRKEADAWLVKTRGEVQKGTHTPESSSCTVTEAAELWLKKCQLEGLERTTIDGYRGNVELHIIPLIGHEKLAKLTTVRVKTFSNDLRDVRKLSNTMARKVLVSFKSILKEAHELGLVAQNVATPVNIKVDKRSKPKPQIGIDIPTKDEVRRILDAAKP